VLPAAELGVSPVTPKTDVKLGSRGASPTPVPTSPFIGAGAGNTSPHMPFTNQIIPSHGSRARLRAASSSPQDT
jgi:hypothetical protein